MSDPLITEDALRALLAPFAARPDGEVRPVFDRTDPILRELEDLVRLCHGRDRIALGVCLLALARTYEAGAWDRALAALLRDAEVARLVDRGGGGAKP